MKTCQYCAEQIQDAAILCKHCGQKLNTASLDDQPAPDRPQKTSPIAWLAAIIFGLVGLGWCASLVSPPPSSATRAAASPNSGAAAAPSFDLALLSSRGEETSGYHIVSGQVKNVTDAPIRSAMAVATWYDKAGNFITSDDALIDFNPILPGQTSPFKTMSRTNPEMQKYTVAFKTIGGQTLAAEDLRNKPAAAAPETAGAPATWFQVRTGAGDSFYHGANCKRVVGEPKFLSLADAAKTLKACPTCKPPLVKNGHAIHQ